MRRIFIYLFLISFVANSSFAQPQVIFGYGFGKYTVGLNSMKFHAFQMNEFYNDYWTDKLEVNNWMRGGELEFRFIEGHFAYTAWISHRRSDFSAGGINPIDNFDESFKVKVRMNHFSMFGCEYVGENFSVGLSLCELGKLKVFYKIKNTENPDGTKWEDFYDDQTGILSSNNSYGNTFYVRMEAGRLQAKLSYYLDWFGVSPWFGLNQFSYLPNNLFLQLNFNFGKVD